MAGSMAGMLLLAVASLLYCHSAFAQRESTFQVLSGAAARELELTQSPENLEIAARTGETVFIEFRLPQMAAVVQEEVNAVLDCLPWLSQYPGGSIRWFRTQIDEFGNMGSTVELTPTDMGRIRVGGQFNRFVNITRTVIVEGGEDPDSGVYQCEVCTDRGTPFEVCHVSNTTLLLIGSPPDINDTNSNAPPDSVMTDDPRGDIITYRIGADFCIRMSSLFTLVIECGIVALDIDMGIASAFPAPDRMWTRDGVEVYTAQAGQSADDALLMSDFFMQGLNLLFMPGVITPGNAFIVTNEGEIRFGLSGTNLTEDTSILEELERLGVNQDNFRRFLFEQILGSWVCRANNSIGEDSAESAIRECGIDPVIPGCPLGIGDVLFPDDGEIVPVGCNVCVPEGTEVVLDCSVSTGSPPISYVWFDETGTVRSNIARLTVSDQGNYTCSVSNLDRQDVLATTVLSFSPRVDFSAVLTNPFVGEVFENGCQRLRIPMLEPDYCPFVGEQLDFTCMSEQSMDLLLIDPAGNVANGSITINSTTVENANGTFSCQLNNIPGPCGDATRDLVVRVYDPARIDRAIDIPLGEFNFGCGRLQGPNIAANVTVTLYCPSSGIDDPVNIWYRIGTDPYGVAQEVAVMDDPAAGIRITNDTGSIPERITTTLEIDDFSVFNEGTYVCRSTNIAGEDACTATVFTQPDGAIWVAGVWSDCDPDCREGIRFRSVVCRSTWDDRVVPDSECSQTNIPPSMQNCSDFRDDACLLTPVWIPYAFSPCSRGCLGGFRTRTVLCQIPRTGEVLEPYRCNNFRMPSRFEFCDNTCCVNDEYPRFCRSAGVNFCGASRQFKKFCCWTCGLTVIP